MSVFPPISLSYVVIKIGKQTIAGIAMSLSLEKQLHHRTFCDEVDRLRSLEDVKEALKDMHKLYLVQKETYMLMLKEDPLCSDNSKF